MTSVLVVGSGSIGARHARNLAALGAEVVITDPDDKRAAGVASAVGASARPFSMDVFADQSGVVIASPTSEHAVQAEAALAAGARVLVEKPAACRVADLGPIESNADRVMLGYNLRLYAPVEQFMQLVHDGRVGGIMSARLWFGSWLPDWRPDTDYRESYSARAGLGGGVLLDAIHEVDLLLWLAGDDRFDVVGAVVDRLGPLEIDSEDSVHALLRHGDGWVVELALDYLSRTYRRGIEVVGTEATARLDWARKVIELERATGSESWAMTASVDESYVREAERFLAFVETGAPPVVDGLEGGRSLRLAEAIRAAAR